MTATAPEASSAPEAAPADPAAVLDRLETAIADGDADAACALLAGSARRQTEEASIGGSCEDWVSELSGTYTDELRARARNTEVLEVLEEGDRATVRYTSPVLDIPLELELERQGGAWRITKLAEGV